MKDRKQKQTDDEIEAEVLAKLGDASAWDVLPSAPPSSSPRPGWARAGFRAAEERTFEASRTATPSQRLVWLEQALAFAYKVGALKLDPPEGLEPSSDPTTPPERERNGVPLLPQRPKESQRPDMEKINRLRDET
jgi:hypothetical protein